MDFLAENWEMISAVIGTVLGLVAGYGQGKKKRPPVPSGPGGSISPAGD